MAYTPQGLLHIPQFDYQAPTSSPQTEARPAVLFSTHNGTHWSSLYDAYVGEVAQLDHADELCYVIQNQRVTVRILVKKTHFTLRWLYLLADTQFQWPGYPAWTFVNMVVSDSTNQANRPTYRRLVRALANVVKRFFDVSAYPLSVLSG